MAAKIRCLKNARLLLGHPVYLYVMNNVLVLATAWLQRPLHQSRISCFAICALDWRPITVLADMFLMTPHAAHSAYRTLQCLHFAGSGLMTSIGAY